MGFDDLIRSGVALANRLTADMQATVTHYAWTGAGSYGTPVYAPGVSRLAIVDFRQRLRRLANGQEILQQAQLTFLEPMQANGASGRREPIDNRDKIVLPNGYTGPIIEVAGPVDPETSSPYVLEVALG